MQQHLIALVLLHETPVQLLCLGNLGLQLALLQGKVALALDEVLVHAENLLSELGDNVFLRSQCSCMGCVILSYLLLNDRWNDVELFAAGGCLSL